MFPSFGDVPLPHRHGGCHARTALPPTGKITGRQLCHRRASHSWRLFHGESSEALAHATFDQDTAWLLFTKGIDVGTARQKLGIVGDERLGSMILQMVAVMA